MKPFALIPARGGSKRLPRKNILPFMGIPLIHWPIRAALNSGVFEQVIVSTDDDEIAEFSKQTGAAVIMRPNEFAVDAATVVEVCAHALGLLPDVKDLCCIYATAALIELEDLRASFALYKQRRFNSIMGVSRYDLSPLQALEQVDGRWRLKWPELGNSQSQKHPLLLCSAGVFYWIQADILLRERSFYTDNMGVFEIPRSRLCDINTLDDFARAEELAKLLPQFQIKR